MIRSPLLQKKAKASPDVDMKTLVFAEEKIPARTSIQEPPVSPIASLAPVMLRLSAITDIPMAYAMIGKHMDHASMVMVAGTATQLSSLKFPPSLF